MNIREEEDSVLIVAYAAPDERGTSVAFRVSFGVVDDTPTVKTCRLCFRRGIAIDRKYKVTIGWTTNRTESVLQESRRRTLCGSLKQIFEGAIAIEGCALEIALNVSSLPMGSFGTVSPAINDFFGSPKGSLKPSYRLATSW